MVSTTSLKYLRNLRLVQR